MDGRGLFARLRSALKKGRKREYVIYIGLAAVAVLVYAMTINSDGKASPQGDRAGIVGESSSDSFATERELEERLEAILSKINGAGKVEVMITFDTTEEKVPALSSSVQSSSFEDGGTLNRNETSTPATISKSGSNEPIVLTQIYPKVRGVIVLAQGADEISVKLDLQYAVMAVLGVEADYIEVFKMSTLE